MCLINKLWIYLKLYNEKKQKNKQTKKKTSKLIKIYLVSSRNRSAAVISVPPSLQFSKPLTLISIHFRKKEKKEKNVNFSGMYVSSVQGPPLYTFVYLFIFHFHFISFFVHLFYFNIFPKTIFKSTFWFTLTWRSVVTWSILKSKFHLDQYIETYRQNIDTFFTLAL